MSTLTACGMVTEGLLGGQTGADGFTSAPVKGERKTVTVSKAGPSLGLHITNDSSGCALIEGIDPGSIAHEAPGFCVGDRIVAINGTTVVGTGHRHVAAMIAWVPVGGIVVFGLIEPERESSSAPVSQLSSIIYCDRVTICHAIYSNC